MVQSVSSIISRKLDFIIRNFRLQMLQFHNKMNPRAFLLEF